MTNHFIDRRNPERDRRNPTLLVGRNPFSRDAVTLDHPGVCSEDEVKCAAGVLVLVLALIGALATVAIWEPGRCLEAFSRSMAGFAPLGPREPDFAAASTARQVALHMSSTRPRATAATAISSVCLWASCMRNATDCAQALERQRLRTRPPESAGLDRFPSGREPKAQARARPSRPRRHRLGE